MFHFCNLAKAIGDENRLRIIMVLQDEPLCVCQLTSILDLAPSTTSKHLSILRNAQLIECIKNGRWSYYQLPKNPANPSIAKALTWIMESLESDGKILEDKAKIKEVKCAEKEDSTENTSPVHIPYLHSLTE